LICVIIPSLNSERVLVQTLTALVVGATDGLVHEVILADGGSRDETEMIADAAGCNFMPGPADPGARLCAAAKAARGTWLMYLDPAAVLEEGWTREVRAFIETAERTGLSERKAAAFRLRVEGFGLQPRLKETAAAMRLSLLGRPRAEQGLLISKRFYEVIGGHAPGAHAHRRLLARIGRRVVALRSRIVIAAQPVA
jgi:glycosyltransferase involved in cell wall biosynthesis